MKYLAIDIGSSFVKAALIDLDSKTIINQKKFPQSPKMASNSRKFEVDGNLMFETVRQLIDAYIGQYRTDIKGILFSTQMHGFILADSRANPVTPYVSWQDERCLDTIQDGGVTYLEKMMSFITREDMTQTGVYLKPPLAMCNLYTLLQSGFPVASGTHFCTIGSYIIFRLTGVNACHITNAGPTGFADVQRGRWSERMIELAGAQAFTFPLLVSDYTMCGIYRTCGLEIPVYPDIGDQQAGALGSLAVPLSDAIVNIGTGAQLGMIRPDFIPGPYEIRPFFDGQYLYTITRLPGGRNLDVLINFFADIASTVTHQSVSAQDVWNAVQTGMHSVDSHGLQADCSFFKSEYSDSGHISDIYFDNLTLYTVVSAAFEDIARTYQTALEKLGLAGSNVNRLVFSGGLANRLQLLRNVIMRQLGIDRSIAPIDNEVFVGLYRLALHIQNHGKAILATRNDICSEHDQQCDLLISTIEAGRDISV